MYNTYSNLRAVGVDWNDDQKTVDIYFYYDQGVTDENVDEAHSVEEWLSTKFEAYVDTQDHNIHLDAPQPIPQHMRLVYLRKEPITQQATLSL